MEADWSVELTADDPVIAVPWEAPGESFRFVDLRENPQAIDEIEEARREPALHSALLAINSAGSPNLDGKVRHLDERTAGKQDRSMGDGCRPGRGGVWRRMLHRHPAARPASFAVQEQWVRVLTETLRGVELRCARIELVLRPAVVRGVAGFGVTCFVQGCGASTELAASRWAEALILALPALMQVAPVPLRPSSE